MGGPLLQTPRGRGSPGGTVNRYFEATDPEDTDAVRAAELANRLLDANPEILEDAREAVLKAWLSGDWAERVPWNEP